MITKYISIVTNKWKNSTFKSGVLYCEKIPRYVNVLDDWRHIYMTKDMCIIRFANIFSTFILGLPAHALRHISEILLFVCLFILIFGIRQQYRSNIHASLNRGL